MGHKSKFNKHKCVNCKYHGIMSNRDFSNVHCYYINSGTSCLYREGKKVIDRRGEDYNNCLLYERGK